MNINKLKKTIKGISEKTKNRELLEKILKECDVSRSACSELMIYKNGSSFDHYVYRYKEEQFPPEFSYLFLNAAFSALNFRDIKKIKNKKKSFEDFKKNKNKLWRNQKGQFFRIISDCIKLDIKNKLIIPALEFHALNLIRLGNLDEKREFNENFVENYLRIACADAFDYIEESDQENFQEQLPTKKFQQYEKLISNLRNFYPIIESLRYIFMRDFLAPNEYKKINIINSKTHNDRYESMVLSKDFLRVELGLSNLKNIFLLNINDDNMKGSFEKNDKVLVKKHPSFLNLENNNPSMISSYKFKDGVYAIKIPDFTINDETKEKIVIRRLQFTYPNQDIKDYEIPSFLEEEAEKEINKVFKKGLKNVKLAEIDQLVNKYGVGNPLLVKNLKPIINLEESQDDFFYGKKIQKDKNFKVKVNIISDDKKYPPISVDLEVLPIVGEVIWKSSAYNNIDNKFNQTITNKNLFIDETTSDIDIPEFLFNQNQMKETA